MISNVNGNIHQQRFNLRMDLIARKGLKPEEAQTEVDLKLPLPQRPPRKRQFIVNEFVQSDILEAERVKRAFLSGYDGNHNSPAFIAHLQPSTMFCLDYLIPIYDIEIVKQLDSKIDGFCQHLTIMKRGNRSAAGASQSSNEWVAFFFSQRNACRQLLLTKELVEEQLEFGIGEPYSEESYKHLWAQPEDPSFAYDNNRLGRYGDNTP